MIKNRPIITSILFLFFIVMGILIWRASLLFANLTTILPDIETHLSTEQGAITQHKEFTKLNAPPHTTDKNNTAHDETINNIIEKIRQNVIVTGTITGTPGKESALFQIEKGVVDRSFSINTHLMDGFIITKITENHVTLKNHLSKTTISLPVEYTNRGEFMPSNEQINAELEMNQKRLHNESLNQALANQASQNNVPLSQEQLNQERQKQKQPYYDSLKHAASNQSFLKNTELSQEQLDQERRKQKHPDHTP